MKDRLKKLKPNPRNAFERVCTDLVNRYLTHHVSRDAAALTYYILFACFPLIILISSVIGKLDLDPKEITSLIEEFMPIAVTNLMETYITYVTEHQSEARLIFSIIFSVYFPWRAINALSISINKAYNQRNLIRPVNRFFATWILTFGSLVYIFLLFFLTMVGKRALTLLTRFVSISQRFIHLWSYLRFIALFAVALITITFFYMFGSGIRKRLREVFPGTVFSIVCSMFTNLIYSYYVEHFAKYNELYGSIANIIILLIWIWANSLFLILGAEFNAAILKERQ